MRELVPAEASLSGAGPTRLVHQGDDEEQQQRVGDGGACPRFGLEGKRQAVPASARWVTDKRERPSGPASRTASYLETRSPPIASTMELSCHRSTYSAAKYDSNDDQSAMICGRNGVKDATPRYNNRIVC